MKSKIEKHETGLRLSVQQTRYKRDALLDAFQECQEGRCACPTNEYEKLEAIDVQTEKDAIHIYLKPKPGHTVDESAVQDCLDFAIERATKV